MKIPQVLMHITDFFPHKNHSEVEGSCSPILCGKLYFEFAPDLAEYNFQQDGVE